MLEHIPGEAPTGEPTPRQRRRFLWNLLSAMGAILAGWFGIKLWTHWGIPGDAARIGASLDSAWHARLGISTTNYQVALARSTARLVELRSRDTRIDAVLDQIDGLLLTGGGDIDPALYDGDTSLARLVDRSRDDFESGLLRGAIARDMPVLGICRGIQLLNVIYGGDLKDLRSDPASAARHGIGLGSLVAHSITIATGSRLAETLGPGDHQVNSFHGQGVDRIGQGLQVVARAEDGLVEGLELPAATFVVTTQWHPEVPPQQKMLFDRFIRAASDYRDRKADRPGSG